MMVPEREWLEYLRAGRFMLQRAPGNAFVFPPRVAEPGTGDEALAWVEASGRGQVYATTVNRKRPPEADVQIALITLAEGPRMMSRVEGIAPGDVRIGMAVFARIVPGDVPVVVFDPA